MAVVTLLLVACAGKSPGGPDVPGVSATPSPSAGAAAVTFVVTVAAPTAPGDILRVQLLAGGNPGQGDLALYGPSPGCVQGQSYTRVVTLGVGRTISYAFVRANATSAPRVFFQSSFLLGRAQSAAAAYTG